MNKIFSWLTGDLFKKAGEALDGIITSDEERLNAKNALQKMFIDEALNSQKIQTEIINTEAKGNFLQRSWRPILMLGFGFVVLYSKFIAPAFNLPNTALEPDFWELLRLGIGGYVIGRSAEKISTTITKNIDFKKKN
ncbi:3TM-type holin [Tenacibaculum pacificus]|uniref:3TM-type holin n=1 Tax=Tenacibaculum TaxID=104267 RepID=UPI0022F3BFCD|nr:3TM-type holin [Tenacibaculum pacificus]WBX72898.1 3TM-type holin [Tenacibaculum pacificus]